MDTENSEKCEISKARAAFLKGYNCCQSVIKARAKDFGLDEELALKLAEGFGGGVGRMRNVCGAFSALVFLAGLKKGVSNPDAKNKGEVYKLVQQLAEDFKTRCGGSIICAELMEKRKLAAAHSKSPIPEERTAEYYKARPCIEIVDIAEQISREKILP